MTRPFHKHTSRVFFAGLLPPGWLRYKWYQSRTRLLRLCVTYILYHRRLSWHGQELSWSNRIVDSVCMRLVWYLLLSAFFVVLFANSRDIAEGNIVVFVYSNWKWLVRATLSHHCARLIFFDLRRQQSTWCIRLITTLHVHFFYTCSHLRALQNRHTIIATKFLKV